MTEKKDGANSVRSNDLLDGRTKRFIATGNTWPHRETFLSWAWHWDRERKAWIEDNGSEEDEPCIKAILGLPDIKVTFEVDE